MNGMGWMDGWTLVLVGFASVRASDRSSPTGRRRLEVEHLPDQLRVEGRHPLQRALEVRRRQHPLRRPVRRRRRRLGRRGALGDDGARGRRRRRGGLGALGIAVLLLLGLLAQPPGARALAGHADADGLDLGVDGVAELAEGVGEARVVGAVHDAGEVEARVLAAEPVGGAVVGVRGGLGRVVGAEPDAHPVLRQPDLRHPLAPLPLPHTAVHLPPRRRRRRVLRRRAWKGKRVTRRGAGCRRKMVVRLRGGEAAEELALAVVDAGAERRDGDRRREVGEDGVERGGAAGGEQEGGHRGAHLPREAGRGQRAEAGVHG
uniref:Uncharacterized protein n=1 Tax=Triticum urartu TaxID=4572 RepID=A0A8R7K4N2_TRIUA